MSHVEVTLHTTAPSYTKRESKWWAKLLEGVNLKEQGGWALKGSWLKFRPWESCKTYRVGSMEEGDMVVLVAESQVGFWTKPEGGGTSGLFRVKEGAVHEHKDSEDFNVTLKGMELLWAPTDANVQQLSERFPSPLKEKMRSHCLGYRNWAIALVYALDYSDIPKDKIMKEVEEKFEITWQ